MVIILKSKLLSVFNFRQGNNQNKSFKKQPNITNALNLGSFDVIIQVISKIICIIFLWLN